MSSQPPRLQVIDPPGPFDIAAARLKATREPEPPGSLELLQRAQGELDESLDELASARTRLRAMRASLLDAGPPRPAA